MADFKALALIFILCVMHSCSGKPTVETTHELTEGRGITSYIWGWISYPFSWWSSGDVEQPVTEKLVASTIVGPTQDSYVYIRKHNVTVWCNDQTCTTMKCNDTNCRNITCNLYDTDLHGECREYNIIENSEEPKIPIASEVEPNVPVVVETIDTIEDVSEITPQQVDVKIPEERPLVLEAVLSSTVQDHPVQNVGELPDDAKI